MELRCEGYPCIVIAEHPQSMNLFKTIEDVLHEQGEGLSNPGMPLVSAPDLLDGRSLSIMAIGGEDLHGGDARALGEVFAEAFAIMRPVYPDSPEASAPIYTGTGWPD